MADPFQYLNHYGAYADRQGASPRSQTINGTKRLNQLSNPSTISKPYPKVPYPKDNFYGPSGK